MTVTTTVADCRAARAGLGALAFVPTMGALHDGHASLVRLAKLRCPRVAVSIFVNPTQFAPGEDLSRYPRPIERDLAMCAREGVDLVFHPSVDVIYPPGEPRATVDVPGLTDVLEGASRPGHFAGVCTVVLKLFEIVRPDVALFGEKDAQQLAVVRAMARALDVPVEVVAGPTVREADGLALSSRNAYLSADERARATAISRGLFAARAASERGERDREKLVALACADCERAGEVDYVAFLDDETLAAAVRVGRTRLIDNVRLVPSPDTLGEG